MSRLNEKDLELLQAGQTVNLSAAENAYYGGEFTTNPNDCVEVLIYDTNDNLLESGIADTTDYSYDYDTIYASTIARGSRPLHFLLVWR